MPRFSFQYNFTDKTSLNGSIGLFIQSLPLALLVQQNEFAKLEQPRAVYHILGLEHLINESTLFTFEVYHKDYSGFPMDSEQPKLFILDKIIYQQLFFSGHVELLDRGKAFTSGVEVVFQKKLARDLYGMITGSYFKARYKDLTGEWRDRVFDNRYQFAIEGGYKPNDRWEFSARWIFAGGRPYTPFDSEQTKILNHGIFDDSRINAARYPDYHSLNIRLDRRFYFMDSGIIIYISVWNAYNRKNVLSYYWNKIE